MINGTPTRRRARVRTPAPVPREFSRSLSGIGMGAWSTVSAGYGRATTVRACGHVPLLALTHRQPACAHGPAFRSGGCDMAKLRDPFPQAYLVARSGKVSFQLSSRFGRQLFRLEAQYSAVATSRRNRSYADRTLALTVQGRPHMWCALHTSMYVVFGPDAHVAILRGRDS